MVIYYLELLEVPADKIGIHVSQVKRYEAGTAQPTLDVFRKIVLALNISADNMIFGNERGPDKGLKLHFEAVSKLTTEEQAVIKEIIEGMVLKHDANRWSNQKNKG